MSTPLILLVCLMALFALSQLARRSENASWLPLDSFSGLLWLCVSALWGIVLLDLIDLIPPGWRLIPVERLSKPVRIIATLLALVLFAVSAITMAFFVFWGQVQISSL